MISSVEDAELSNAVSSLEEFAVWLGEHPQLSSFHVRLPLEPRSTAPQAIPRHPDALPAFHKGVQAVASGDPLLVPLPPPSLAS